MTLLYSFFINFIGIKTQCMQIFSIVLEIVSGYLQSIEVLKTEFMSSAILIKSQFLYHYARPLYIYIYIYHNRNELHCI